MIPVLHVTTESGTRYSFTQGMTHVRWGEEWTECHLAHIAIGQSMQLHVGERGELRLTTPVKFIEEV